jgi:acetylornithine aminotransferase/4-aminobutyrate aminotransferase
VITAKGLASGFPLSAFGAREELMDRGWLGSQGGTYGGNAVSCAAALATLEVIEEEGLVENAARLGAALRGRLEEVQREYPVIGDVRGAGLMLGTEIVDEHGDGDGERAQRIVAEMETRSVLLLRCGTRGQVVRWLPPLVIRREHVDSAVDAFASALAATRPTR